MDLLFGFLLVLARIAGALVFVPLPGFKNVSEPARVALGLGLTMALASRWPVVDAAAMTTGRLTAWVLAEGATGLAMGVAIAIVLEAFSLAGQMVGLQAGYAYASTIDPNSEADSGVLLVMAQLVAGMLFFTMGLDRELLRLFALSLERVPPGSYHFAPQCTNAIVSVGATLFSTGVRLALPVVALLVLVDVALALLGRLNAQLQLLSLAFPIKMLLGLLLLSWIAARFPNLMLEMNGYAWTVTRRMLSL